MLKICQWRWRREVGFCLTVEAFFCGRDQFGPNSSEFVSQFDGFLQGHGGAVELRDDYEVERTRRLVLWVDQG